MSEHGEQTLEENQCRELLIKDVVSGWDLTPEERVFVNQYLMEEAGAWRHYNGTDVTVEHGYIEDGILTIIFAMPGDQVVEAKISLPTTG